MRRLSSYKVPSEDGVPPALAVDLDDRLPLESCAAQAADTSDDDYGRRSRTSACWRTTAPAFVSSLCP